jgi:hypothetical protein
VKHVNRPLIAKSGSGFRLSIVFSPRWRFNIAQHQKVQHKNCKYLNVEKMHSSLNTSVKDDQIIRQKLQVSSFSVLKMNFARHIAMAQRLH